MAAQTCAICGRKREGRFARISLDARVIGMSKDEHAKAKLLPAYYCFTCLKKGHGRGETEGETQPTPAIPSGVMITREQGMALLTPIKPALDALVSTGGRYWTMIDMQMADALFGRIKIARKTWKLKMYGTAATPGPIPNIRAGLEQLYELNRDVDKPMEAAEALIEKEMKAFRFEERRQLQEAEDERKRIEDEQVRQLEELQRKQDAARTPTFKAKLQERMEKMQAEVFETMMQPTTQALVGESSSTREKKVPQVNDVMAFITGIAEGIIPLSCIQLRQPELNRLYKDDPDTVAAFPGVAIVDDMVIVGR